MTSEDLEIVVAHTGVVRYRDLTSEANPDAEQRDGYRRYVAEKAAELRGGPTLLDKAVSLTKAAAAFAASGFDTVDQEEFGRRHGICEACEKFDAGRDLCNICGCAMGYKPRMKVARCPIGKW